MYSNVYGVEGPKKLIQILKSEILADAAQVGITDLHNIPSKVVSNDTSCVGVNWLTVLPAQHSCPGARRLPDGRELESINQRRDICKSMNIYHNVSCIKHRHPNNAPLYLPSPWLYI